MTLKNFWPAMAAAAVLTACGGGGGGGDTTASASTTTNYPSVLAQLNTAAGLTDPSVAAAFDNAYLDSGMTKAQLLDALAKEAVAMGAASDHSLFPQVALSNVALSQCDANGVCTLSGTLTNADGDGTSVDFSTQVVSVNGAYKLLGDQQAS